MAVAVFWGRGLAPAGGKLGQAGAGQRWCAPTGGGACPLAAWPRTAEPAMHMPSTWQDIGYHGSEVHDATPSIIEHRLRQVGCWPVWGVLVRTGGVLAQTRFCQWVSAAEADAVLHRGLPRPKVSKDFGTRPGVATPPPDCLPAPQLFPEIDANHDGVVSTEELQRHLYRNGMQMSRRRADMEFIDSDTNHDGELEWNGMADGAGRKRPGEVGGWPAGGGHGGGWPRPAAQSASCAAAQLHRPARAPQARCLGTSTW